MRSSNNREKKTLSQTYWRVQLMYESSGSQFFRTTTGIKSGPSWPLPSWLQFLETFLANNFALSDAEDIPLLRILLAICQKSQEQSFWEVRESFVLVAYASLAASRTLLQQLLAYLNFTLDSEDLFCWCIQKSDFYEPWQQHKLLKTMELCEACPDTCDETYIQQV